MNFKTVSDTLSTYAQSLREIASKNCHFSEVFSRLISTREQENSMTESEWMNIRQELLDSTIPLNNGHIVSFEGTDTDTLYAKLDRGIPELIAGYDNRFHSPFFEDEVVLHNATDPGEEQMDLPIIDLVADITDKWKTDDLSQQIIEICNNPDASMGELQNFIISKKSAATSNVFNFLDSFEGYLQGAASPFSAMYMWVRDSARTLNSLTVTGGKIDFSECPDVAVSFTAPVNLIVQSAAAALSALISIFQPVIGVVLYSAYSIATKVAEFVSENMSTESIALVDKFEAPAVGIPVFQVKQVGDQSLYAANISELVNKFKGESNSSYMIKIYWMSVMIYAWFDSTDNSYNMEGFIIPCWMPVRDGAGNDWHVAQTGNREWWLESLFREYDQPVEYATDGHGSFWFYFNQQVQSGYDLYSRCKIYFDKYYLDPVYVSQQPDWFRLHATAQSFYWLGVMLSPIWKLLDITLDTSTYEVNQDFSVDSPNVWVACFKAAGLSMWAFESVASPVIGRVIPDPITWASLTNTIAPYIRRNVAHALTIEPGVNTSMCLLTSRATNEYNVFSTSDTYVWQQERDVIEIRYGRGNFLIIPPKITIDVISQLILVAVVSVGLVVTGAVLGIKVKRAIRNHSYLRVQQLAAQKSELDNLIAKGLADPSDYQAYFRSAKRYNRWAKIFGQTQWDAMNAWCDGVADATEVQSATEVSAGSDIRTVGNIISKDLFSE